MRTDWIRSKWSERGDCYRCGKPKQQDGFKGCESCRNKEALRKKLKYRIKILGRL